MKQLYNSPNNFSVVVHGLDINPAHPVMRRIVNFSLKKYNNIIAVSGYTASKLPQKFNDKIQIINNGVDLDRLSNLIKSTSTENIIKLKGNPSLITVGTVWERKGQVNVVKALPSILKQFPQSHYHIVGLPYEIQQIHDLAKKLKVESNISVHGAVSDSELVKLLSGSDIFLMLSKNTPNGDFEGFGIAILEANFLGVPAIGSMNCGIEDAIRSEETGLLINPDNSSELVSAIKRILNNRKEFSHNAKQFSINHSWKIVINKYLAVIKN